MPLLDLKLPAQDAPLPPGVAAFLREADARIERFIETRLDHPIPGFVPSDFVKVYHTLRAIADSRNAPGNRFCEWGSGLGVVASLAAMLHFESHGIEVEPDLVDAAQELADDFDLSVQFTQGSFIPTGGDACTDAVEEMAWLSMDGHDAHEEMGLDPDDFHIIFAYPWPGEEQVIIDLFDRYAAVGAILLTYHGLEDLRIQRKTTPQKHSYTL